MNKIMKKILAVLSLAAVALAAAPALASAHGGDEGKGLGKFFGGVFQHFGHKVPANTFAISGTVVSTGTNSLVLNVQASANIPSLVNSQTTVAVEAGTKVTGPKTTLTLADVKAGDRVEVNGSVSGTTLTAANIKDLGPVPPSPVTTSGKITAVSATSVTIANGLTGASQVFTLDGNSKVTIDGQNKAVADIHVGDAGMIKAKTDSAVFTAKMITLFR